MGKPLPGRSAAESFTKRGPSLLKRQAQHSQATRLEALKMVVRELESVLVRKRRNLYTVASEMKLLLKQRTAALSAGTWGWGDAEPPATGDLARIKTFAKRALSEMVYDEVQSRTGAITAHELQINPRSNKRELQNVFKLAKQLAKALRGEAGDVAASAARKGGVEDVWRQVEQLQRESADLDEALTGCVQGIVRMEQSLQPVGNGVSSGGEGRHGAASAMPLSVHLNLERKLSEMLGNVLGDEGGSVGSVGVF
mmetsp:Transcript_100956/g.289839  ORF Transcript_100956/g.289839 Transcript_100956/m.289839 type:complete len:254 (+) Transcript_100956:5906-6667(+)